MFDMFKEITSKLGVETKENLESALVPFIKELEAQYAKQVDKDSIKSHVLKMTIKTANELYLMLKQ